MNTTKIGVAADLHFGRGGWAGLNQYQTSFREMVAGMIAAGVDYAIFAGDLYQQFAWFNPRTFDMVADGFQELKDAGITVEIIPGNHDYDTTGAYSAVDPFRRMGITVHKEIYGNKYGNCWLTFIPWIPKIGLKAKEVNTALDAQDMAFEIHEKIVIPALENNFKSRALAGFVNQPSICIFHASLIGFSPCATAANIVGTDFMLDPAKVMQYGFNLMVGGHFHRTQSNKANNVMYVGSMERNDFGEKDNPTGWLELSIKDSGDIAKTYYKLETTQRYYEIGDPNDPPPVGTSIEDMKGAFVKIRPHLSRHETLDREALAKDFYAAGALNVIIEPVYVDVEQARSADIRVDQSIAEQFECWAKENETKATDAVKGLLKYENENSFPVEVEPSYFIDAVRRIEA